MKSDRPPQGVRAVALFESSKGLLAVLAASSLLTLMRGGTRRPLQALAERLHIDSAQEYPRAVLSAAKAMTDRHLLVLAAAVFGYACIRFIEAYGLWFGRRWAEWFAALSGAVYIPFELYDLSTGISWFGLGVFTINVLIVGYMSWILYRSRMARLALPA